MMLCLQRIINPSSCIDMPARRDLAWTTRPQDVIAEAKAVALASLVVESPKLTRLQRAFLEVYKKNGG